MRINCAIASTSVLGMMSAKLDAHTQATIEEGTTKVKLELNGLRVETQINLSGRSEVSD